MTFKVGDVYRRVNGDHTYFYIIYKIDNEVYTIYIFLNSDESFLRKKRLKYTKEDFEGMLIDFELVENLDISFAAKIMLLSKE